MSDAMVTTVIAVAVGIAVGAVAAWLMCRVQVRKMRKARKARSREAAGEDTARPALLPPSIAPLPAAASPPPPPPPCHDSRENREALPRPDVPAVPIELTDAEIDALPPELPPPVRRPHRKTPPRARRFDRL